MTKLAVNLSMIFTEVPLIERFALAQAGKGDVILIAGKGHEDYQIIGTEKLHYSDRETVAVLLQEEK